ncbi:endonuclease V [Methanofollis fontis]|uniref:Endonuclease V n=1 Tax=Methanofollis fontis TaxID=2052832 RepID=A0A483CU90_9EURY|nr:endonuclease V [Methanofollis fontis]TAJ44874.1 endonuclease V [Methanofollis fontis]
MEGAEILQNAVRLQHDIARHVVTRGNPDPSVLAGLDAAYSLDGSQVFGAAVLLAVPSLRVIGAATVGRKASFPYIPGYFAFREAPALLAALGRLERAPDLLMIDGHGIAHPRRCGIASHVGVITGIPSIGVARHLLTGRCDPPGMGWGETTPVTADGSVIGCALRTVAGVRPVYVSIGHRISLQNAVSITLHTSTGFRIPEPLRVAHRLASHVRDRDVRAFIWLDADALP